jgi:hypothetical protein
MHHIILKIIDRYLMLLLFCMEVCPPRSGKTQVKVSENKSISMERRGSKKGI